MLKYLIAAAVVVLPLVYQTTTLDPTQPLRFLIVAALAVLVSLTLLVRAMRRDRGDNRQALRRAVFPAVVIYVVISAISILQAVNSSEAVYDFSKVALFAALMVCTTLIFASEKQALLVFTKAMTLSGAILAAIGICQYYGIGFTDIPGNSIPYGTMANKNLLSAVLCMTLPFGVYAAFQLGRWWQVVGFLSALLSLMEVIISQTRADWMALAVATLLIIPLYFVRSKDRTLLGEPKKQNRRKKVVLALAVVVILVAGVSGIIIRPGQSSIGQRITSIVTHQDPSSQERLVIWKKSLEMFGGHPLTGIGIGNWKVVYPGLGTAGTRAAAADIYFQQPHNDYLWILAETGIPGLIAFLAVLGLVLWYGIRTLRHADSGEDGLLALALLFAVICAMVDAFFSYPRERIELVTYVAFIFAAMVALCDRDSVAAKGGFRRLALGTLAGCTIIGVVATCLGIVRLNGETHTMKAWLAKGAGNWPEVIAQSNLARSPWLTLDPTSTPLAWYSGVARFSVNDRDGACRDFETAYRDNPNHPHVLNNLGTCAELRGDHETALTYYQRSVAVAPAFDDAWLNLTAVYYNMGEYAKADSVLAQVGNGCTDSRVGVFRERISTVLKKP